MIQLGKALDTNIRVPAIDIRRVAPCRFGSLSPHLILLAAADLLPLAGILWWGWDAFLMLMLYWLETAVAAFWALARIAVVPRGTTAADRGAGSAVRGGLVVFFSLHAGLFMTVHFMFLWLLFAGTWRRQIHGPAEFLARIVVAHGLWLPLLLMFLGGGAAYLRNVLRPAWLIGLLARLIAPRQPAASGGDPGILMLYRRIILMQLAILIGAGISFAIHGSMAPFVVLIVGRTIVDIGWPERTHPVACAVS